MAGNGSAKIAASGKRVVKAQGLLRIPRMPRNCASRVALNSVSAVSATNSTWRFLPLASTRLAETSNAPA